MGYDTRVSSALDDEYVGRLVHVARKTIDVEAGYVLRLKFRQQSGAKNCQDGNLPISWVDRSGYTL